MPVWLGLEGPRCEHGTQAYGLCAQWTFCPLSLIQRKRALLAPVQRSATPVVAQTASLCSNSARDDSLSLPDSPENACFSNVPGRAPFVRTRSLRWQRLTLRTLRGFFSPDTYERWRGPAESALPAFR